MGLTPKTHVLMRKVAPMGDPMELYLRGYELTLRAEEAKNIGIVALPNKDKDRQAQPNRHRHRHGN